MTRDLGRLRAAMAALLVATALLFVVGIFIERGTGSAGSPHVEATSPAADPSATPHAEGSGESSDGGGGAEVSPAAESPGATEAAGESTETHRDSVASESFLGIDPEQPALVGMAVLLSLLTAFLVWRDGRPIVIAGAIVLAFGFGALDLLEVSHQVREGTALIALVAAVVAMGHGLAAAVGVAILRRQQTQ
ncbi:MAG: hypothetical protein QFC55_03135 [Chloroflexota bacterium]|nr:hypothetical protein [Chloroflexota bacterium]